MDTAAKMIMFLANRTADSNEPPNPQNTFHAAGGLISALGNTIEASIFSGENNTNDDQNSLYGTKENTVSMSCF